MKNRKSIAILALLVIAIFSIFAAACGAGDNSEAPGGDYNNGLINNGATGGTLTQEASVDESDVVKTFGNRMYKLQSDGITVYDLENGDGVLVAYYKAPGSRIVPLEMFVSNEIVVGVFGKTNQADDLYGSSYNSNLAYTKTVIKAFDSSLASKDSPLDLSEQEKYSFEVNANMIATRMYVSSKQAYFAFSVVNNYNSYQNDGIDGSYVSLVPSYTENGETKRIDSFEPIPQLYSESGTTWEKGSAATLFMSINARDLEKAAIVSGCYGATLQDLYMSETSIIPIYKNTYRKVEKQGCGSQSYTTSYTYAMKIDTNTLRIIDGVRFEEYSIYDRRAVKDFGDVIYITATKTGNREGTTVVSFDGRTFSKIQTLSKIAPGETVKSVAYEETAEGERYCYITTFREVDPLFKINITNPRSMITEGYIKISGFSTFMIPINGKLLTLGYADNGAQNRASAVRIAIYDTASGGIEPIDELILSNVIECEAIDDPRAICVTGNIVSFAATTRKTNNSYNQSYYGNSYGYYQGLYSFMINEDEIIQLKTLSNYGSPTDYGCMDNVAYYGNKYYSIFSELSYLVKINRARIIDGYIYTVADGLISSYPIDMTTGEIDLLGVKQTVTSLIKPSNLDNCEVDGLNGGNGNGDLNDSSNVETGGGSDVEPDDSSSSGNGSSSSSGDGNFETIE